MIHVFGPRLTRLNPPLEVHILKWTKHLRAMTLEMTIPQPQPPTLMVLSKITSPTPTTHRLTYTELGKQDQPLQPQKQECKALDTINLADYSIVTYTIYNPNALSAMY